MGRVAQVSLAPVGLMTDCSAPRLRRRALSRDAPLAWLGGGRAHVLPHALAQLPARLVGHTTVRRLGALTGIKVGSRFDLFSLPLSRAERQSGNRADTATGLELEQGGGRRLGLA